LVSFLRHFCLWDKAIEFKVVDIIVDSIDSLLVFEDYRFHRLFLWLRYLHPKSLKKPRAVNLIINFTEILLALYHTLQAFLMNRMRAIQPPHQLISACLALEA
jgi:hypothetical protein